MRALHNPLKGIYRALIPSFHTKNQPDELSCKQGWVADPWNVQKPERMQMKMWRVCAKGGGRLGHAGS